CDHILLDCSVAPLLEQGDWRQLLLDGIAAGTVIDRTAIIRIDQAEIPKFAALIDIRHTGCGELERGLRQTVYRSAGCDGIDECSHFCQKCSRLVWVQNSAQKLGTVLLIVGVGLRP